MTKEKEKLLHDEELAILQLRNFVDWFSPNKDVNEKLQNNITNIEKRLKYLEDFEGWKKI